MSEPDAGAVGSEIDPAGTDVAVPGELGVDESDVVDAELIEEDEADDTVDAEDVTETTGGSAPGGVEHEITPVAKSEPPDRIVGGGGGGARGGPAGGFGIASGGQRPININLLPVHLSAHINTTLAAFSGNTIAGAQIAAGVSGRRPHGGRRRPGRRGGGSR